MNIGCSSIAIPNVSLVLLIASVREAIQCVNHLANGDSMCMYCRRYSCAWPTLREIELCLRVAGTGEKEKQEKPGHCHIEGHKSLRRKNNNCFVLPTTLVTKPKNGNGRDGKKRLYGTNSLELTIEMTSFYEYLRYTTSFKEQEPPVDDLPSLQLSTLRPNNPRGSYSPLGVQGMEPFESLKRRRRAATNARKRLQLTDQANKSWPLA